MLAQNIMAFDRVTKNNKVYSREEACKYLDENGWDSTPIIYSVDNEKFQFDWETVETTVTRKVTYSK